MNVDTLISRATHTSGRSLLLLAAVVILSKWYAFPITNSILSSIAKDIPQELVATGTILVMTYLVIVHALNWWNDYLGYKASFSVKVLKEHAEPISVTTGPEPAIDWKEHRLPLEKANRAQRFSIYGQHFALPISAGLLAVYCLIWG